MFPTSRDDVHSETFVVYVKIARAAYYSREESAFATGLTYFKGSQFFLGKLGYSYVIFLLQVYSSPTMSISGLSFIPYFPSTTVCASDISAK